ncbi:hypothetical protein V496_06078 [Pseudogymnoascus sp. VKM F-4515 (FW-2607)]|nr:hypothetical protein V496_06078 [Pseudogymnoascus sp. VKM F-4515 (FW-2607)]KFY96157.1 hypothetical protein V498_02868 [Pseudogymnoascus sp. VKM F-4517 (FW-2822)]
MAFNDSKGFSAEQRWTTGGKRPEDDNGVDPLAECLTEQRFATGRNRLRAEPNNGIQRQQRVWHRTMMDNWRQRA